MTSASDVILSEKIVPMSLQWNWHNLTPVMCNPEVLYNPTLTIIHLAYFNKIVLHNPTHFSYPNRCRTTGSTVPTRTSPLYYGYQIVMMQLVDKIRFLNFCRIHKVPQNHHGRLFKHL